MLGFELAVDGHSRIIVMRSLNVIPEAAESVGGL